MSTAPLVEISHVAKSYRRGVQTVPVLADITLGIGKGDFVALMGPSGSGKSTLLNLIAGIDRPDSGELRVGGLDITRLPEAALAEWRAANVGFIFQFYNLMPVLTAFENIELPLMLTHLTRRERHERVGLVLDMVNLTDRMHHYPSEGTVTLLGCCRKCSDNCGYETNCYPTQRTCQRCYLLCRLPISARRDQLCGMAVLPFSVEPAYG
ncbi:ATP-binding cassette domain-containing protein [Paraburkholderia sp. RL17-337-BIB-A]